MNARRTKLEFELADQAENQQLMHHQVLPLGTNNFRVTLSTIIYKTINRVDNWRQEDSNKKIFMKVLK